MVPGASDLEELKEKEASKDDNEISNQDLDSYITDGYDSDTSDSSVETSFDCKTESENMDSREDLVD